MLKTFLFIYGLIVLAGGIQGYVVAKSIPSIAAGSACAAFILAGAFLLNSQLTLGLVLAGIGALTIAGKFLPTFLKSADKAAALWPAGVLSVLGVVAIVWILLTFVRRAA